MSTYKRLLYCTAIAVLSMVSSELFAQGSALWGQDFYTTFPANEMQDYDTPPSTYFALELFVSTQAQTHVHVSIPFSKFALDRTIEAGTTATITLPSTAICNTHEIIDTGFAVHLTADADVQVEALSHKQMTSDAWSVYPTSILGTSYRTLCFNPSVAPLFGNSQHPGEFDVVATQDNTLVTITPKVMTTAGRIAPFTSTMNAGDVLQVMSAVIDSTYDLTGSLITSDKPIAVLSGHRRTECPYGYAITDGSGFQHSSRDFICEQMPPTTVWAKQAIVVPPLATKPKTLIRILSNDDNNTISINGVARGQINAGEFLQIDTVGPSFIEGTKPILVGEYLHTADSVNGMGDPSLSIADCPPVLGGTHHLYAPTSPLDYSQSIITLIVASADRGSVRLDGSSVPAASYQPINDGAFYFAHPTVSAGDHIVSATVPYTASITGIGPVISYAYTLPTSIFATPALGVNTVTAPSGFTLERIAPNPVTSAANTVLVNYRTSGGTLVEWSLSDMEGRRIANGSKLHANGAEGSIALALGANRPSGIYLLRITASDGNGAPIFSSSQTIVVAR